MPVASPELALPPSSSETREPQDSAPHQLREYLYLVLRYKGVILCCCALAIGLASVWVYTAEKVYRSTARLLINPGRERVLPFSDTYQEDRASVDYYLTQCQLLSSRRILGRVFTELHLGSRPEYREARDKVGGFQRTVVVAPVLGTYLVDIHFDHTDPHFAAKVVNRITDVAVKDALSRYQRDSERAADFLNKELPAARQRLDAAEAALRELSTQTGLVSFDRNSNILLSRLEQLSADLTRAEQKRIELEATYEMIREAGPAPQKFAALPAIADLPAILEQQRKIAYLTDERSDQLLRYGADHREVANVDRKLKDAQAALDTLLHQRARALEKQYRATQAVEQKTRALLEEQKRTVGAFNEQYAKYLRLNAEETEARSLYRTLQSRQAEVNITGRFQGVPLECVDAAEPAITPVKPRKLLSLAVAALVGLFVGLSLAFLLHYLDDSIRHEEDMEAFLGLNAIGLIPGIPKVASENHEEMLAEAVFHPASSASESFRALRTALILSAEPRATPSLTVLVSSALPAEGKTTIATNLAAAFALNNQKTLLLQTDLRRPTNYAAYGLQDGPGLGEILRGKAELPQGVQTADNLPQLDILPSGEVPPNPAELLASPKMNELVRWAQSHYEVTVMDSAPLISVADAQALAQLADIVVMVVHGGRTSRKVVQRSIQLLRRVRASRIGVILNDRTANLGRYRYGAPYYYSYYYPRYRRQAAGSAASRRRAERNAHDPAKKYSPKP